MKIKHVIAYLLLATFALLSPQSAAAQEIQKISRTSLARMDVLSRAKLFEAVIDKAAISEGVDPLILWTIAYNETRFRPWLTSPKNAQGMMQFMPATAVRFGLANPYEPTTSVFAAAKYVRYLSGLFDGNLESILAAYNAGEGTVSAYLKGHTLSSNGKVINRSRARRRNGVPPYKETIRYVAQGVEIYHWLQQQGRFGQRLEIGSPLIAESSSYEGPKEKGPVAVFYEPRTGKRTRINEVTSDRSQKLASGPVVISSVVPHLPTSQARSTFAGTSRQREPDK